MIDLRRKQESRHCIECFRCVSPAASGGLYLRLRRPGEEVERIRAHHPDGAEVWFLFLGSGAALGGFLWQMLPLFDTLRDVLGAWAIEHGWSWIGTPGPGWLMVVQPQQREVFIWLDFFMIIGFMLAVMVALTLVLAFVTWLAAWISGRLGGDGTLHGRFVELGYQVAPTAMVSLLLGLGGGLFEAMAWAGMSAAALSALKTGLFILGNAWSLHLGDRILHGQGLRFWSRKAALMPGFAGSLFRGGGLVAGAVRGMRR
jgi:hypothetical protein